MLTRTSSALSYEWGDEAPADDVPADNFSVRFSSRPVFAAGTYRFYLRADDEARLSIDFQSRIDTFGTPQPGQILTADVTLSQGSHQLQVDYRERTGNASVALSWEPLSDGASGPNFPVPVNPVFIDVPVGQWTAQYYANPSLGGLPTAITSQDEISADWGNDSPFVSLPDDEFSARWTAFPTLEAGRYRVRARSDDGVRVFVDGQLMIDEWAESQDRAFTREMDLQAGDHIIVVEYYENTGRAFIEFSLGRQDDTVPTPTPAPTVLPTPIGGSSGGIIVSDGVQQPRETGAIGVVNVFRLNVRDLPNTGGAIVTKLDEGTRVSIVGQNADQTWWQVSANGTIGWAAAQFLDTSNTGSVPITNNDTRQSVETTAFTLTAIASVNIRSEATTRSAIIGTLPNGAGAAIAGRNATNTWWQIVHAGRVGWVNDGFVNVPNDIDLNQVPIR